VCKEVDVSAVRSKSHNHYMASKVRFLNRRKGLVLGVDKSCSVVGALQPCFFYVLFASLLLLARCGSARELESSL
jgi:hypothetical protein